MFQTTNCIVELLAHRLEVTLCLLYFPQEVTIFCLKFFDDQFLLVDLVIVQIL